MVGKVKPHLLSIFVGLGLAAAVLLAAGAPPAAAPHGSEGERTPPSPDCAGGCSAAAPDEEPLGRDRLSSLFGALSNQPPGTPGAELDEILFAGVEAAAHLENENLRLDPAWTRFLKAELERQEARIQVRMEGEDGSMAIRVDKIVHLGKRTHVAPERTRGLTPPEVTLTVRRVGLHHLWIRL